MLEKMLMPLANSLDFPESVAISYRYPSQIWPAAESFDS